LAQLKSTSQRASTSSIDEVKRALSSFLPGVTSDFSELAAAIRKELVSRRTRTDQLQDLDLKVEQLQQRQRQLDVSAAEFAKLVEERRRLEAETSRAEARRLEAQKRLEEYRQGSPIQAALAQLREQGTIVGLRDGRCPLCGSVVTADQFTQHLQEIERTVKQHSEELAQVAQSEAIAANEFQRLRLAYEDITRTHDRMASLPTQLSRDNEELELRAESLGVPLDRKQISTETARLRAEIQELENGLSVLESSRALARITELERARENKETQLRRDQLAVELAKVARQDARDTAAAIRRISGEIVDQRLASLSPLFSELYLRLRPHEEWSQIQYLMRGDVRRFLSFEVGPGMNPRFVFSSGQRRALAVAFLLAVHLSRTWAKLDTLVLDDPIQHIDDFRALHLTETLASIRQMRRQIICMVENPDLADLMCRRLRAESGGEGLRIEMDFAPGEGVKVSSITQVKPMPARVLMSA
jgi:chromosome segregation protein